MNNKILGLLVILILFLAGCIQINDVEGPDSDDPTGESSDSNELPENNNLAQELQDAPDRFQDGQTELTLGNYFASLDNNDTDFYTFTVGPGEWFNLTVSPDSDLDLQLLVHDSGGKDITWDFTYYTGNTTVGQSTFKINAGIAGKPEGFWSQMDSAEESYSHYFSVTPVGGFGDYTIELEVIPQNDGNSGRDVGSGPVGAVEISSDGAHSGLLNWNDRKDCYKLSTGAQASVTVQPTPALDVLLTIHSEGGVDKTWDLTYYDKTNKDYSAFGINDASEGLPESVTWEATSNVQFICIEKKKGFGNYTISYS